MGWTIFARNLRVGRDEIDILARDHDTLVVVEVRFRRKGLLSADLSLDASKLRRLSRAASKLRSSLRLRRDLRIRVDAVLVSSSSQFAHYRDVLPHPL